MDKQEIVKIERQAQQLLESLQNEGATFLFLADEGNCFTIGGLPSNIGAQILFSMMRYPVVKAIIKTCAERYDELEKKYGDEARNIVLEHIIEKTLGTSKHY
jgi:hypothetical protein